jgi:protein involved in polysaccharide export with SLBB domain
MKPWPLLCIICLVGLIATAYAEKNSDYRLSSNDLLEINVYDEKDLSKTVRVAPDGTISFPLLGNVLVSGLTPSQVEQKITSLLAEDYLVNPQVNVLVKEFAQIFVMGQVKAPGAYQLKDGMTVIGAIAMAGGFTDLASSNNVRIVRIIEGREQIYTVPIGSMLQGTDRSKDISLQPNDTILVPESFF